MKATQQLKDESECRTRVQSLGQYKTSGELTGYPAQFLKMPAFKKTPQ